MIHPHHGIHCPVKVNTETSPQTKYIQGITGWEGLVHIATLQLSHIQMSWALSKMVIWQARTEAMNARSPWIQGVSQRQETEGGPWQGMTAEHMGTEDIVTKAAYKSQRLRGLPEFMREKKKFWKMSCSYSVRILSNHRMLPRLFVPHFNLSHKNKLQTQPISESSSSHICQGVTTRYLIVAHNHKRVFLSSGTESFCNSYPLTKFNCLWSWWIWYSSLPHDGPSDSGSSHVFLKSFIL